MPQMQPRIKTHLFTVFFTKICLHQMPQMPTNTQFTHNPRKDNTAVHNLAGKPPALGHYVPSLIRCGRCDVLVVVLLIIDIDRSVVNSLAIVNYSLVVFIDD